MKRRASRKFTLSPALNYHHTCLFASEVVGEDGKVRKVYRDADRATPYEKLKSIPDAQRFLKPRERLLVTVLP